MTARTPGLPGGRKGDVVEATGGPKGSEVGPEDGAELPPPEDGPIAGELLDGRTDSGSEIQSPPAGAVTRSRDDSHDGDTTHAWWIRTAGWQCHS